MFGSPEHCLIIPALLNHKEMFNQSEKYIHIKKLLEVGGGGREHSHSFLDSLSCQEQTG